MKRSEQFRSRIRTHKRFFPAHRAQAYTSLVDRGAFPHSLLRVRQPWRWSTAWQAHRLGRWGKAAGFRTLADGFAVWATGRRRQCGSGIFCFGYSSCRQWSMAELASPWLSDGR